MRPSVVLFLALASTNGAVAETLPDSVFEINQTCAENGCFAGDSAGFPVTINVPGHYRLSSNLNLASASYGILVNNVYGHVTIDLKGMTIAGKNHCDGRPVSGCIWTGGSGYGIAALGPKSLTIRNGRIANIWGSGLRVGSWSANPGSITVQDLEIEHSSSDGAYLRGDTVQMERVKVRQNGGNGLTVSSHDYTNGAITLRGLDLIGNASYGILVFANHAFIEESTFLANGSYGLINGGVFTRSLFRGNNGGGMQVYNNGPSDMGGNRCGTTAPFTCVAY